MKQEIDEILSDPANMITGQYSTSQVKSAFKAGQKSIIEAVKTLHEISKIDGSKKEIVDSFEIALAIVVEFLPELKKP